MSIKLVSTGGGSVTIAEPNTASDFTLSVPAATADLLTSSSDLTTQVKSATNASGSAPVYSCRAWINFDGTGATSIRGSGNVSSLTDNAVGQWTINFTTSMQDTNYSVTVGSYRVSSWTDGGDEVGTRNTGNVRVVHTESNTSTDTSTLCVAIHR